MTSSSGAFTVLLAVAWFGAGAYAVVTSLRHRRYVNALPQTAGNRRLKRENQAWLLLGAAMIVIGAWNTYVRLGF